MNTHLARLALVSLLPLFSVPAFALDDPANISVESLVFAIPGAVRQELANAELAQVDGGVALLDWEKIESRVAGGELLSAPRITIGVGVTPTKETASVGHTLIRNAPLASRKLGGVSLQQVFDTLGYPAPADPKTFMFQRGVIGDLRTTKVPYVRSKDAAMRRIRHAETFSGIAIGIKVVSADDSDRMTLEYVFHQRSEPRKTTSPLPELDEAIARLDQCHFEHTFQAEHDTPVAFLIPAKENYRLVVVTASRLPVRVASAK